jgi:hypothetical protein
MLIIPAYYSRRSVLLAGAVRIADYFLMKLAFPFNVVATNSLPRLLGIGCAAAYLLLAGCSTFASGTPNASVNYREPAAAQTEDHSGSLEQVIKDQRDWYQMIN